MKALDETKYHPILVAFSALRPEHHIKDPALFDKLNEAMKENLPMNFAGLANALLPNGDAKNQLLLFVTNLMAGLPTLKDILADPLNAKVPFDTHFQYVVASAIAKSIQHSNYKAIMLNSAIPTLSRLEPDLARGVTSRFVEDLSNHSRDQEAVIAFTKYLARLEPDIAAIAAADIGFYNPEFQELPELKALIK